MAELFLAREKARDELLVIKRILPYLAQDPQFVRMFLDEARIAAQLHHPNIITLHELGALEGSLFIAMEFVDGVDLRKLLQHEQRRSRAIPHAIAASIIARVCEGLHYAHNRAGLDGRPLEIIHRDVSPQNVMVGYDGQVKLVDFGIAKANAIMERSKPGVIKGKFLYLAPEQLSREHADHRADLFAVGSMLYELTTGKSPFQRATTEAVIYAVRTEEPEPPERVMPGYPPELSRIVMRCLSKDRDRRYQQANEIAQDLEAFLASSEPAQTSAIADYVDSLFGDGGERTMLHIPAPTEAHEERTRLDRPNQAAPGRGARNPLRSTPVTTPRPQRRPASAEYPAAGAPRRAAKPAPRPPGPQIVILDDEDDESTVNFATLSSPAPGTRSISRRIVFSALVAGALIIVGAAVARSFREGSAPAADPAQGGAPTRPVIFRAPGGTKLSVGSQALEPGTTYLFAPGPLTVRYACDRGTQADGERTFAVEDRAETQVFRVPCGSVR